ncbi:MAG: DUF885 domain-containing protein [Idiomarina sp.]|nr:DUF885 domain-containing protein [Idiomarina sp.]
MRYLIGLFSLMLLSACASAPSPMYTVDQQFDSIANEVMDFEANERRGDPEHPARLFDISPAALERRYEVRQGFYAQLDAIETDRLSAENQINRDMLMYGLRNNISNYRYNMHLTPLTNETGPHNQIARTVGNARIRNQEDATLYVERLKQIPDYFAQQMAYMREGIALGITQPAVVLRGMPDSIGAYVTMDPSDSVFYAPVQAARQHLSAEAMQTLDLDVQTVISTYVNPAFLEFQDFMVDEYIPNARQAIAAIDLPNGEAFYADRVRHYTTTDLTAEEIHAIGLREVRRIRAEMDEVIAETGFEGSFAEFIEYLRTDPKFYATTEEELLKEAAWIAKRADAALPRLFGRLPRTPYGVAPVPAEIAPTYTTGRYLSSSADDEPGYYWVNTYALDRRPLYELEALTLHEGVPGHHLQIALAQEMEDVPSYRRTTYISAFGEGWGLYAEYLGLEAGFYQDPYSNFGRLTYEMWRAARLVVDTGMHTMGWSRDRAVAFLANNTALSMHNVNTEIDRYISWPAQALSYKLGVLLIKDLRAEAEAALGSRFDVREFHDEVLKNGSIPLATLEQQIRDYIARKQAE